MTPDAKAVELARWEQVKAERPADALDAVGFPDPPIYALCDRMNQMPGLCTLQSCAGHRMPYPANEGDGFYYHSAQLWLWPDEWTARRFYLSARQLRQRRLIENVRLLWVPHEHPGDSREIIDVIFPGVWSPDWIEAQGAIVHFFSRLMAQHPLAGKLGPDDPENAGCASSEPCLDGAKGRHAPSPVENRDSGASDLG